MLNALPLVPVGTLSHGLYLIWLAEGTDLREDVAADSALTALNAGQQATMPGQQGEDKQQ